MIAGLQDIKRLFRHSIDHSYESLPIKADPMGLAVPRRADIFTGTLWLLPRQSTTVLFPGNQDRKVSRLARGTGHHLHGFETRVMRLLWKWLMILLSILLLLAGLLTFPLPFPVGIPLLLIGLALSMRHSSDAKRLLIRLSRRFPPLHRLLDKRKEKPYRDPAEDSIE